MAQENLIKNFKELGINPETFSTDSKFLDLQEMGWEERFPKKESLDLGKFTHLYKDKNTGEIYHQIFEYPELQKFTALLLKGIMNVSDVIEINGKYFSHEQDSNSLKSKENYFEEILADLFILKEVIHDLDHRYYQLDKKQEIYSMGSGIVPEKSFIEHANLLVDENQKNFNIFDFHSSFSMLNKNNTLYLEELEKIYISALSNKEFQNGNRKEILEIIDKKCSRFLEEVFNNKSSEFFDAVVKNSKINFDHIRFDDLNFKSSDQIGKSHEFLNLIRERFILLKKVLNEELKK